MSYPDAGSPGLGSIMNTTKGPVVFVVDDDPGIRESLCFFFEETGYEVLEAQDGIEALDMLKAGGSPCIMLLDRMMARLDGAQTLQRLVGMSDEIQRRVAVVFMTARNAPLSPEISTFVQQHTLATITKPFNLDELLVIVEQARIWLNGHSANA